MSSQRSGLRVTPFATWPSQLTFRRGVSVASARPWNSTHDDASLRLERGGSRFLARCVEELKRLGAPSAFSPPLPPAGCAVWQNAGFATFLELALLRLELIDALPPPAHAVASGEVTDDIVAIDAAAFDDFWAFDRPGLIEALSATRRAEVLTVGNPPSGFAILGHGLSFSYLQRVAVHPRAQGSGLGTALVLESARRARAAGNRSMFLNTQTDNVPSLALYERVGFQRMEEGLLLLRA